MNRNELEEIGLTKEQINKVLDNYHANIKTLNTEVEQMKTQIEELNADLTTKNKDIKELSNKTQSAEETQQALKELQAKYEKESIAYTEKLQNMEFEGILDKAISSFNGRNSKAVKALLDLDTLKSSADKEKDITTALKSLVENEETSFLFTQTEAAPIAQKSVIGSVAPKSNTNYLDNYYQNNPFYKK